MPVQSSAPITYHLPKIHTIFSFFFTTNFGQVSFWYSLKICSTESASNVKPAHRESHALADISELSKKLTSDPTWRKRPTHRFIKGLQKAVVGCPCKYLRYQWFNLRLLLEATSTTRLTLRMCHGCVYTGSFVLDYQALYLQHVVSIE